MKGFSVQGGMEYRVNVSGEKWNQGDALEVEIRTADQARIFIAVAEGNDKKIRSKSEDAFEILESKEGSGPGLTARFRLPENSRITDKSGSLYLLYGSADPPPPSFS